MKKGIFLNGKLKGYKPGERQVPTREIPGTKYVAEDGFEVMIWNATYVFTQDGTVIVKPHNQLKQE